MRNERNANEPIQLLKDRRRIGGLTQQETVKAIIEYQSSDDASRKRDLEELVISAHLPGVLRIIKPHHSMQHEELLSLVYFAMKKAMNRFNPKKNTTFLTYMRLWMRNELQRNRTDEEFRLYRQPFERNALYLACKSIDAQLTQSLGTPPSITDIHQEGVRRKNPLFVNKHGIISIKGLADLIAEMEIPIMSLQTERHNEYEYLSSHTSLSPSSRALIHELHANAKGLFEDYLSFLVGQLGFMEADLCLEYLLLGKTYKDAGSIHQLSRERVRKIISVQIPECFSELGWHSPSILSELAAITLLTYEFCGDTPSPILERLSNLNHELTEVSLSTFTDNVDYLSVFHRLRQTIAKNRRYEPIIFKRSKSTPYRSAKERYEIACRSQDLPSQLKTTQDLLQALRVTQLHDEPQDQRLFPFGRETLYLLYSDTHSRTSIDDLLSKAHRQGDIILYRNAIQGEAIKFWPSPASPVLATTEHKPSADSALSFPVRLTPPSRVFHHHQRQQRLIA